MSSGILTMMLIGSLFLGSLAVIAFIWALKTGQFDDEEKFKNAVLFDNEEDLRAAVKLEKKKKELKKQKKENYKPE